MYSVVEFKYLIEQNKINYNIDINRYTIKLIWLWEVHNLSTVRALPMANTWDRIGLRY